MIEPEGLNPGIEPRDSGSEARSCQPVHLLVVDDEDMMRTFLREVLKEEGYDVDLAASGDEAVRMLGQDSYDIVLTDIVMPGMDGLGVVAAARKMSSDVDVIVMTGYASMETAVESMKLGAADYITKPFNIDQIRIIVANVVKERRLRRKAAEGEFYKELSRKDGLTELYNHRYFHQLLEAEVGRAERYGRSVNLIMIDIDHFKQYNDAHGHPAGDMALRKLAHILKRCVRSCDYVARYGGEEFAIIVPEIDLCAARSMAERVRALVDESEFEGEEVMPLGRLTVSIGLAAFPAHAATKEEFVERSDQALYAAKAASRNCVVVADEARLN